MEEKMDIKMYRQINDEIIRKIFQSDKTIDYMTLIARCNYPGCSATLMIRVRPCLSFSQTLALKSWAVVGNGLRCPMHIADDHDK